MKRLMNLYYWYSYLFKYHTRSEFVNGWEFNACYLRRTYHAHINWDERYYVCPFCGDRVYEDEWKETVWYICPFCQE